MRKQISTLLLITFVTASAFTQTRQSAKPDAPPLTEKVIEKAKDDVQAKLLLRRSQLESEIGSLILDSNKLVDAPLAEASAKADIAAALWSLDEAGAKMLLRQAHELTLPSKEERQQRQPYKVSDNLPFPNSKDSGRGMIRARIMRLAARDANFAGELIAIQRDQLNPEHAHMSYANLASEALNRDDLESAGRYTSQAFELDPTHTAAGLTLPKIALRDRALADKLTIEIIERLRALQLPLNSQGMMRAHFTLHQSLNLDESPVIPFLPEMQGVIIPRAGANAVRAFVNFVIESTAREARLNPSNATRLRPRLMYVWLPLQKYAPDLAPAFLEVEALTRRSGESNQLPTEESWKEEMQRGAKQRDTNLENELKSKDEPDRMTIQLAISRGEFEKSRKLINRMTEGRIKTQLINMLLAAEAKHHLTTNNDFLKAETLAAQLTAVNQIASTYLLLINACAKSKDAACSLDNLYANSLKQIKNADTTPEEPPPGIPTSVTARVFDPVMMSLSRFAVALAPTHQDLAFQILDDTIQFANRTALDASTGRISFEPQAFKLLAAKDAERAKQLANNLQERFHRMTALANVYAQQAEDLSKTQSDNREPKVTPPPVSTTKRTAKEN